MTDAMPYELERRILIRARPDAVFRHFTDPDRWAAWWGAGSTIEPRPGGELLVRYPNGIEARGRVVEIEPPRRVVFTFGYVTGNPIPPGASLVTIELEPDPAGTRLHLRHRFADPGARDAHVQGWRYQLSIFANVVSDALHAAAGNVVEAWFSAWSEPDAARRQEILEAALAPSIRFRDRFSCVEGREDLLPQITAALQFMPGFRLERMGETRHCQGTVVADWVGRGPDGVQRLRGTNVFTLDADGRIEEVVGLWAGR